MGLYLNAVLRGCYRLSVAAVIFLQIVLSRSSYRWLADQVISRAQDNDGKSAAHELKHA